MDDGCAWFLYLEVFSSMPIVLDKRLKKAKKTVTIGSFMFIHPRQEKHACQSEQWHRGTNGLSIDLEQDSSPKSFAKFQCDAMIINDSNAQNELHDKHNTTPMFSCIFM